MERLEPNPFCSDRSSSGDACGKCNGCLAEAERLRYPDLISGDWLLGTSDGADVYATVYAARITGGFSGGVTATVSHRVMVRIVHDQATFTALHPDQDVLTWDGMTVVHTSPDVDPDFSYRIEPNAQGEYDVPGWTWCRVDPDVDSYQAVVA